jgi:chitin synthase
VLIFTWFNISSLWLTFSIIINLLPDSAGIHLFGTPSATAWVNYGALWLYAGCLCLSFVLALGNKPKAERKAYLFAFIVNGVLGYYLCV